MDDKLCFGKYQEKAANCTRCEYRESCSFYTADVKRDARDRHLVSLDRNYYRIAAEIPAADTDDTNDKHCDLVSALAHFFRYLLELDDYTAGIISEVIAPSEKNCTPDVTKLAKLHGCSRQALHRKILSEIALRPELGALFMGVFTKLQRSRRAFLFHQSRTVEAV